MEKDLQQQNFLAILRVMKPISGWEVLEEEKLLALKAPGAFPFVNFVWGEVNQKFLQKALSFFDTKSFYWLLTQKQNTKYNDILIQNGFKGPDAFPEMILNMDQYIAIKHPPHIEIKLVNTPELFQQWVHTAAEGLSLDHNAIEEFLIPLGNMAETPKFLAFYNGEPAATSMIYCDKKTNTAGLYFLCTRPCFRRKGLGSAVTDAALQAVRLSGISYAVLYASAMGKSMYEKLGFQTSQLLYEYAYEANL